MGTFASSQSLARYSDPAVPKFDVIPNAPEAGGRGTLRQHPALVPSAGPHPPHAAPPISSTPLQPYMHRKVPLVRASARPFGMTTRISEIVYKNSTNESATSAPALFAIRIACRSTFALVFEGLCVLDVEFEGEKRDHIPVVGRWLLVVGQTIKPTTNDQRTKTTTASYAITSAATRSVTNASITSPTLISP